MSYDQPTDADLSADMITPPSDQVVSLPPLSDAMRSGIERMPNWLRCQYETRLATLVNDVRLPGAFAEVVAFREAVATKKRHDAARKAVELAIETCREFPGSTVAVTDLGLGDEGR